MLKRIRELIGKRAKRPATAAEVSPVEPPVDALAEPPVRPVVHKGPQIVHQPIPEQDLDPDAVRIVRRLARFDHAAYLVGGCVRDLLLDRKPKDFDIATSATPRQVKRSFSNCRIIGRRFRLAHVYFQNGKIIEVATFRARDVPDDAAPPSGEDLLIRDDNVFGTPEEDALRRDFTINALFYDVNNGNVIDHADGLGDLRRRLVRTIGDPNVRFREDPIRILRAIKFAARLGFSIEERTRRALRDHRGDIPKAAAPRILEEINRFCRGGSARASFDLLHDTEVFEVILPELAAAYPPDSEARAILAALLDDVDARRGADGRDILTGEIFARLLVPVLAWPSDGAGRDAVDAILKPIALRLRASRKDQEICRQTLLTLQRMVPARPIRRVARQALLKRPAAEDALRILRVVAAARGGMWTEALDAWSAPEPAVERGPREPIPAPTVDEGEAAPGAPTGRRRRRRRRGRRGGTAPEGATMPKPVAAPKPAAPRPASPKLPPVWDDDYFFAALPTAPPSDPDDAAGDRYGAAVVVPEASAEPEPGAAPGPRRKRRRGRRGRGRGRGPGTSAEAAPDADSSAEGD